MIFYYIFQVSASKDKSMYVGKCRYQSIQNKEVIGYYPQFDALSEMLAGRDLLEIYADMKGIPRSM